VTKAYDKLDQAAQCIANHIVKRPNPNMNPPSKAERISFWQHAYARASFAQARLECQFLLSTNPPLNSTLRRALTIAIVMLYSRPFKQRKSVRLSEDIVPAEFRSTHDDIIEIRDKSIAHRDLDAPVADWGFISQLLVNIQSGELTIDTISPLLANEKAHELLPLLDALIGKMAAVSLEFINKHLSQMHAFDGSYVVSLDDSPSSWLLPAQG